MSDCDDSSRTPVSVKIGVTRLIVFKKLRDVAGAFFDPTGWAIRGIARAGRVDGTVVAVWSDTPTGIEGLAEVVAADTDVDPSADPAEWWLALHIEPAMSDAWTFSRAPLDVEVREPSGDLRQEVFSALIKTVPTTMYGVDA